MRTSSFLWTEGAEIPSTQDNRNADLILAFGTRATLASGAGPLRAAFPGAALLAGSTSGEILDTAVHEQTIAVTAIHFDRTRVRVVATRCPDVSHSAQAGTELGVALADASLSHVFVMSNGLHVNGTELASALQNAIGPNPRITGGLAGDEAAFQETFVVANDASGADLVAAVGFYGDALEVGYASQGGWREFGPIRQISRSQGSVLYELDGKSALAKYKEYLGEHAMELPASALLFPILVTRTGAQRGVVRTVLAVDDAASSMTFAGDIPEGGAAQLMRANTDALVAGAEGAARTALSGMSGPPDLALLVSCVGRRLVMKQRVEEELEAVREVVGPTTLLTGFYSYGELCPIGPGDPCELHNQTMTVTLLRERA